MKDGQMGKLAHELKLAQTKSRDERTKKPPSKVQPEEVFHKKRVPFPPFRSEFRQIALRTRE